jgi:hypothetical protein
LLAGIYPYNFSGSAGAVAGVAGAAEKKLLRKPRGFCASCEAVVSATDEGAFCFEGVVDEMLFLLTSGSGTGGGIRTVALLRGVVSI